MLGLIQLANKGEYRSIACPIRSQWLCSVSQLKLIGLIFKSNHQRKSHHWCLNRVSQGYQRRLTTPVPAPPKLPSESQQQQQQLHSISFSEPMERSDCLRAEAECLHNQYQHQQQMQPQANLDCPAAADGSLDNIQMIVDEENTSFTSPTSHSQDVNFPINQKYIFATSDEPYKMSTLRPINKRAEPPDAIAIGDGRVGHSTAMTATGNMARPSQGSITTTSNNNNNNNLSSRGSDAANFLRGAEHVVHFDDLNLQEIISEPRVSFSDRQQLHEMPPLADGDGMKTNGPIILTSNQHRRSDHSRLARKYHTSDCIATKENRLEWILPDRFVPLEGSRRGADLSNRNFRLRLLST